MNSLPIRKIALYILLVVVGFFIWRAWQTDSAQHQAASAAAVASKTQAPVTNQGQSTQRAQNDAQATFVPKSFTPSNSIGSKPVSINNSHPITQATTSDTAATSTQTIHVHTATIDATIDLATGSLHTLGLSAYPVSLSNPNPFMLFEQNATHNYQSQSGLVDAQGKPLVVHYQTNKKSYELMPGQAVLNVTLHGIATNGMHVDKIYTFYPKSYVIDVAYQLTNHGTKTQSYSLYGQLTRQPSVDKGSIVSNRAYKGASISSPAKPYEEIKYSWLDSNELSRQIQGGWIAQQQQYFITAWVPKTHQVNNYYSHTQFKTNDAGKEANIYTVGFVAPAVDVAPGATVTTDARLYAGPEIAKTLKMVAPGLDLSVDYGWLWMLSKLIFTVMAYIDTVVHNWGFSIILVTLIIKLCFYKLSEHSYRSMAKMKKLAPKIKLLKDRYPDDKQALSKATMELYRKEKVNPAGGCLPMLVQVPFFFALYYVLIESVQLRQAPFIFWVRDLSVHDPYYVLPILVGLSMFLQQRMSPPPPDPAQAKMMMLLPVVFTVFFLKFPAGLTLYWLTNNLLTVLQQWYVMRKFDNPDYVKKQQKLERQKNKKRLQKS